jgi:hypothetical protein
MPEEGSSTSQPQAQVSSRLNDDSVIKFNDNEYRFGDLSEPAQQLMRALQNSEQQILNTRNQLGLMDVGRRALAAQLRVAIENPDQFKSDQQQDQ